MATPSSPPPPPSSAWVVSRIKFRFFTRIRRFLLSRSDHKRCQQFLSIPDHQTHSEKPINRVILDHSTETEDMNHFCSMNDDVVEFEVVLDNNNDYDDDGESMVLQKSVKKLHFGDLEEKKLAAKNIQRLAKEDVKKKKVMAELGVIQVLVSMAKTEVCSVRQAALKALIELANGTYTNKALIVDAGICGNLPKNLDESTRHDYATLLLSLSSLSNTHFQVASSEVLPFLINILESKTSSIETNKSCLSALYNFSSSLDNTGPLVSNGAVETLLEVSTIKELSEKSLATLGNLVVTLNGKKALEKSRFVPESLIEVLSWEDKPKCQEFSAYILMILAHQGSTQREKMANAGIITVLLEVSLLGSALTQKRAVKLLQWFKDERHAKIGPHSGPQTRRRVSMGSSSVNAREGHDGKKFMKNLVKQSLYKNMEMITQRANFGDEDCASSSSKLKSMMMSSSSKSLPY